MAEYGVETVFGSQIESLIGDLAALRIEVFREYPYLYEGSLAYEQRYLRSYADSPDAAVVVARHGQAVVGAATAMPARSAEPEVRDALEAAGLMLGEGFYFGESVLRRAHRGQRLGHAFFDGREAAARKAGARWAAFCAVRRPADHPLRPLDYRPLDAFWRARGYVQRPDVEAVFLWPDIGDAEETPKPMTFWIREL